MLLSEFREKLRGLSLEEFVARHPYNFLIVSKVESADAPDGPSFRTRVASASIAPTASAGEVEIWPVLRDGNSDSFMVTIGRTRNCDIVLASPAISKLHAYIQRDVAGAGYTLADAGSRNGTRLNGKRLPAKTPSPLADGDHVDLADRFKATFASARRVFELVPDLGRNTYPGPPVR